ncbi:MAG TPA: HAD family phosphatase [Bacteroidales bacterium]|jgi:putative hydrolase of the HAD superfamily|nr:HAD family phosphatase [Bacteroidales bacterium]MDD4235746.1 HAD family phosphatase [Bacteroidales bacterium]HXK81786.1 HAD family phosphatase [Bacteroidales bacterium]
MKKNLQFSTIIFDLGNVVLNIYPERTEQAFKDLGLNSFNEYYTLVSQTKIFDLLETGKISPKEFYKYLREITGIKLTDQQIEFAWNQVIGYYPKPNIEYLLKLKDKLPIFLLSNTNAIHYPVYTKLLDNDFGIANLNELFKKCFLSHEIAYRKPDVEIYKYVQEEINFSSNEILFIDDSIANIEAANNIGWQTILYTHNKIEDALFNVVNL